MGMSKASAAQTATISPSEGRGCRPCDAKGRTVRGCLTSSGSPAVESSPIGSKDMSKDRPATQSEPGLGGRGLTIRSSITIRCRPRLQISSPDPIINADNPERVSWGWLRRRTTRKSVSLLTGSISRFAGGAVTPICSATSSMVRSPAQSVHHADSSLLALKRLALMLRDPANTAGCVGLCRPHGRFDRPSRTSARTARSAGSIPACLIGAKRRGPV
jgi:hypothetical protein